MWKKKTNKQTEGIRKSMFKMTVRKLLSVSERFPIFTRPVDVGKFFMQVSSFNRV